MANQFPPRVTVKNSDVELGRSFLVKNALIVEDLDPDSQIVSYRFRDNDAGQTTGYFIFKGVRQAANVWFTVAANEINQLFYRSGLILGSESIGAQVNDGQFDSQAAFGIMSTVPLNDKRPIVSIEDFNVLAGEWVRLSDYVSASDPNGNEIVSYRIIDRRSNVNGGFFTVNNVRQTSGEFFDVAADKLATVRYFGGVFGQQERIGIFANDGRFFSKLDQSVATTDHNVFRPTVTAKDITIPKNQTISVRDMYQYNDPDGNTLKRLRIVDTGSNPTSGFFSYQGNKLPAGDFRWFNANQISDLTYTAADRGALETVRFQVFDGRHLSAVSSGVATTLDKPTLVLDPVLSLNDFEFVDFIDVVSEGPGVPAFRYEIIDLNDDPISGKIRLNNTLLEAGQVHTINGLNIERLRFQGGSSSDEGRKFDQFVFRSFNGTWSDWERIDLDTTEVAEDALLDLGEWPDAKTSFTYSFPNELPTQHAGGPGDSNFQPMTVDQRRVVREIYEHLSTFTNLTFTEVSGTQGGDLELFTADLAASVGAGVLGIGFPPQNLPNETAGDFIIDNSGTSGDLSSPVFGELPYTVVLHELGHTMGLKHVDNDTGAGESPLLPPPLVDMRFSVMPSIANPPVGSTSGLYAGTFQLFDIAALQRVYGANMDYNTGNTQIRGRTINDATFGSIWDAGGYDTINRTRDTIGAIIDLNQGRFSSLGGEDRNVSIAYGVEIEAARGGSGDDTLLGNELNNLLIGNNGGDTLRGDGGRDVLRGLAGNDIFQMQLGDGFDIINEANKGGRDTIEITAWGNLDDFTEDLAFRKVGRNLVFNFNVDLGLAQGGMTIANQQWGGSRIETLRFLNLDGEEIVPDVDLTSIFQNATSIGQRFRVTETVGQFGNIAVPV